MANRLKITHISKKSSERTVIFDNTNSSDSVINGVGTLVTGLPITEAMDDGMNTAVLNLKGCNGEAIPELFQPYDAVEISQDGSVAVQWLVAIDQRQIDNAYEKTYEKIVSLVEPTKFLDTIYIYNCNLTYKGGTLYTQVYRLLKNAEITINSEPIRLSVTTETVKVLQSFSTEDFFFDNITLREALYRMFECAHIRPYVPQLLFTSGDISEIRISHKSKNKFTDITSLTGYGEYLGDEGEISIDNYFGTLKARGYNSVVKNVQKTGIRPFTTPEAKLTDENVLADLGLPIEDIRKFQVGGSFELQITYYDSVASTTVDGFIYIGNPGTNVTFFNGSFFWDISKSLIDNELYECLSTDEKNEHMPYTRGSTVIGMSKTYKTLLFAKSTIKTVINKDNNIPGYINGSLQNFKGSQIYKFLKTNNVPDSHGKTDYLNDNNTWSNVVIVSPIMGLFFQAEFIPRVDTVIEVSKPGVYDNDRLRIGVLDGQNANSIDILRHGRTLGSLARRTGNEELKLDFHCGNFDQLMPVMGRFKGLDGRNKYLNGYVITKREYGIYDNELKVRYYCTKDFQAMNERIGVNREKRLYNIPLEASDCPIHIKYYITLSTKQPMSYQKAQNSNLLMELVNGIINTTRNEDTRISFIYLTPHVSSDGADVGTYALPCLTYAADKSVVFMAQPLDNYSAGYTRGGRKIDWISGGGMTMVYNRYVDSDGECNNPTIYLASRQAVANNVNNYPKVTIGGERTKSDSIQVNYTKDRTQRPVFFVSFEFLPAEDSYGDIVFGETIASQNSQVISETQESRAVYMGGKTYSPGDTKVNGDVLTGALSDYFRLVSDENNNIYLYVNRDIKLTTGKQSIAIGDASGNLIIGFNDMNLWANQKFYFDVRRKF